MSDAVTDTTHIPLAVPVQIMPSQQKLLEQLHYLTTFHNSMVILAGPEGAGKSTLLEVFLEQASDYANLAYLCATPRLSIENVRERLFQQISSDSRAQPNASLSKTIRRALPEEPQHLMLVVDDAHTLEPAIIEELQDLVLHSRFTGGKHRVSVVISGTTDWAARQRKVLPSNNTDQPEIVLIPELDDSEALAFAKALLFGHEKGKALAMDNFRIQATLGTSLLYPGIIQAQLQELVSPIPAARYKVSDDDVVLSSHTRPAKAKTKASSPTSSKPKRNGLRLFIIMAAVAMLIAATVTGWLHQDRLFAEYQAYKAMRAGEVLVVEEASTATNNPDTSTDDVTAPPVETAPATTPKSALEQGEGQVVMSYDQALPRLTEAARNFESNRDIELNLIAQPSKTTPASASNERASETPATVPAVVAAEPEPTAGAEVAEPVAEPSQPESNNPWLTSHDNAYFLSAPANQVVLQLGAVASQAALNRFLANVAGSETTEELWVYHTLRNERSWYVVVTGHYGSLTEARAAIAGLPDSMQALQPWAKPVAWIKNELAVVVEE